MVILSLRKNSESSHFMKNKYIIDSFLMFKCGLGKKQSGFLLPLLLVMMLAASGLALMLINNVDKPALQLTTSAIASKSVSAAKVGAELSSHALFFNSSSPITNRQEMDSQCQQMNYNFGAPGLNDCQVSVSCECRYETNEVCDVGDINNYNGVASVDWSFYQLVSEASCGTGFAQGFYRYSLSKKSPF